MFINDLFFKVREIISTSPAKRDKLISIAIIIAAMVDVVLWLIVPIYFWQSKDLVVLQYNIYFGISSFGPWLVLFSMPILGLLVLIVNATLSFWLYLKYRILSYFLAILLCGRNLRTLYAFVMQ